MTEEEKIKHFVQDILGCGCPEDVFDSIESVRDTALNSDITIKQKIVIGKRLLIYIYSPGGTLNGAIAEERISALLRLGQDERDRMGYNRFRLVVTARPGTPIHKAARRSYDSFEKKDEKMHLHLLGDEYRNGI